MKKVIKTFIGLLIFIFVLILYIDNNDKNYQNELTDKIINNTDIKDIEYINNYDDYYIVMNKDNLYLFNNEYDEIFKIDCILIHENKKKYDIIYKDGTLMYMNDYYNGKQLVYEYYNLYTYELIKRVFVGGKNE